MAAQSGFDMRDRNPGQLRAQRAAESAGGVPLDHDKIGIAKHSTGAPRHLPGMDMRVRLPCTAKRNDWKLGHAELGRTKARMLTRQHDERANAASDQRFGEWSELDGFRTGTNN